MTRIISITNHKGGVGKTTSAVNIGAGLFNKGRNVLLIDLDPQANLTQSLGVKDPEFTIDGALLGAHPLHPVRIMTGTSNGYIWDIIPSSLDLAGAEVRLMSEMGRESILDGLIKPLRRKYDYILIDTPPSLGLFPINAFTASTEVFIPLQAQYLALQGLSKLLEVIDTIRRKVNRGLQVGGVFITQYDSRKVLNRTVVEEINSQFPGKVFKSVIRDNVALAEAPISGKDIFRYNSSSYGAEDYGALCKEILKQEK